MLDLYTHFISDILLSFQMDDDLDDSNLSTSNMERIPLTQNIQEDLLSSPSGNGADIHMQHVERIAKQAIEVFGWVKTVYLFFWNNK